MRRSQCDAPAGGLQQDTVGRADDGTGGNMARLQTPRDVRGDFTAELVGRKQALAHGPVHLGLKDKGLDRRTHDIGHGDGIANGCRIRTYGRSQPGGHLGGSVAGDGGVGKGLASHRHKIGTTRCHGDRSAGVLQRHQRGLPNGRVGHAAVRVGQPANRADVGHDTADRGLERDVARSYAGLRLHTHAGSQQNIATLSRHRHTTPSGSNVSIQRERTFNPTRI